ARLRAPAGRGGQGERGAARDADLGRQEGADLAVEAGALRSGEAAPARHVRSRGAGRADRIHHGLLMALALSVFAVVALIAFECARGAMPAIAAFGPGFLVGRSWDPVADTFGALPYLYGTAVSSAL